MVRRKKEYQQLQNAFASEENRLVILSGREGIGKTTLLQEFAKGKQVFFYQAAECSEKEQRYLLSRAWRQRYSLPKVDNVSESTRLTENNETKKPEGYLDLFIDICRKESGKTVIVLEDFLLMAKNDTHIYQDIMKLLENESSVMVVLTISTMIWREEELKIEERNFVKNITDRIVLEPFSFLEMVNYFPKLPVGDIVQIYAILGGIPGYLKYWDTSKSLKENLIALFLEEESVFAKEPARYMKSVLRELSLYNTVLYAMTGGITKLNDIYEATGFSRAKIFVYMKNLKQLGVVNKVKTIGVRCRDHEVKGLYEITDPMVHFWYRFIYPNQSSIKTLGTEHFFQQMIQGEIEAYTSPYFGKVCCQYLDLMNNHQKLPWQYDKAGAWYGKDGTIQLLAKNKEGKLLLMHSKWQQEKFSTKDMEKILRYLIQSGIEPEYYYLFSKSDFDKELRKKADYVKNMILVDLKEL